MSVRPVDDMIYSHNRDMFLSQEHWLTPANLYKFDNHFTERLTFGSSCDAVSRSDRYILSYNRQLSINKHDYFTLCWFCWHTFTFIIRRYFKWNVVVASAMC